MKKTFIFILLLLSPTLLLAQSVDKMNARPIQVEKWIDNHFGKGKRPPFSFVYDGKPSSSFITRWNHSIQKQKAADEGQVSYLVSYADPQTGLRVDCTVNGYADYGAIDWMLRFTNTGTSNTPQISQVRTADLSLQYAQKGSFLLHYASGSTAARSDFAPRLKEFFSGDSLKMRPAGGRSSDTAFPFFNIESPASQGVLVAIGWSGTWNSVIRQTNEQTVSLTAALDHFNSYLTAGESIRGLSVCLLFWQGNDRMVGHNKFRRFMLNHHSRKINGQPVYYPIFGGLNWGDPSPCNEYTCMTTEYAIALIQRMKLFKLNPEAYWLDAGWYKGAAEYYDGKNWYNTAGNWLVDSTRFSTGLKPISDYTHKAQNADFMVWFEPERVYKDTYWAQLHPEWMLRADGDNYLFNLADPEACCWMSKTIGDLMEQNGIDIYRQDFNIAPEAIWKAQDKPGRQGITEVKYIEGLYQFWDYLLQRFPHSLIDNCASGGRRIDYETMLRSAPMWRTDYRYGEPIGYQCHTYGLEFYLPQHATGSYKVDRFDARSSMGRAVVFNYKLTQQGQFYLEMQKCYEEFREVRPYYYEDFYPLSGVGDLTKDDIWLAYQLHRPADQSGYIVAFRRQDCLQRDYVVRLSGLDPEHVYTLKNKDSGAEIRKTGRQLSEGFTLTLDNPRTSLLIKYQ